jgi:uncharacterized protein
VASVTRRRVPAVEGWFTLDEEAPRLLGSRCTSCGTIAFPKASSFCGRPGCAGTAFDEAPLSRVGRVWSYTDARYRPPPPYIPVSDPHEPFAIAAVELADERIVVLGQVVPGVGVDELAVGAEMELVVEPLYSDEECDYLVWKWRPTSGKAGRA